MMWSYLQMVFVNQNLKCTFSFIVLLENHCMNCGLCRSLKHKLPYLNESETPDYLSNGGSTLTQIIQDAWLQNRFVCTGFKNMHCEFWESTLNWSSYCPLFLDTWMLNWSKWEVNNFCPQPHTTPNPKPQSFPSGSSGKESACNARDTGDSGLIPGLGRSLGEGNSNPLPYFCLKILMDRGSQWATVHGVSKNWTRLYTCTDFSPEYSLEGLILKLKFQYFGHLMWRTDSLEKTLMLGKIEGRRKRGMTEDEMIGWHHRLNGQEFEQALGVGDGQGSLVCCSPWGCNLINLCGENILTSGWRSCVMMQKTILEKFSILGRNWTRE